MNPIGFAVAAALGNVVGALAVVRHERRSLQFIDACLAFSDLPGRAFHLSVGTLADGVRVAPCPPDHAPVDARRAIDLVEGLAGRRPTEAALAGLPEAVAAQVRRASLTL